MITAQTIATGGLGRMGNQLFTIAGVIGIATKSGQSYGFPKWVNHDNALFGGQRDDMAEFFANPLPSSDGISFEHYGYFWGYRDIKFPNGNWNIDAHMQSDKFTKHCMPLIRDTFRMKDEPDQNEYVAIHYRAGDYIDSPDAQHPRCSKEYYEQAMALFPREKFWLFSDSVPTWFSMMGIERTDPRFHGSGVGQSYFYADDFKNMKQCKSFITANSSFSSMAALLGEHPDKKIVQPSRWFGTSMPHEFGVEDLYHENAIII